VKALIAAAVLLALSSVPALAADKSKPERPDAKFLAAVDKAIAAAQEKAVPTPKLLKLAKVLIKKGRLIRANEVAALIARKKTEADQATAKKINTAVAQFKGIVGSWDISTSEYVFTADRKVLQPDGYQLGTWNALSPGVYESRTRGQIRRIVVAGLTCSATFTRNAGEPHIVGKPYPGKRVK